MSRWPRAFRNTRYSTGLREFGAHCIITVDTAYIRNIFTAIRLILEILTPLDISSKIKILTTYTLLRFKLNFMNYYHFFLFLSLSLSLSQCKMYNFSDEMEIYLRFRAHTSRNKQNAHTPRATQITFAT